MPKECFEDLSEKFCPDHDKVYDECGSGCPNACDRRVPDCLVPDCVPGCYCKAPRILDRVNGSLCILPRFCPYIRPHSLLHSLPPRDAPAPFTRASLQLPLPTPRPSPLFSPTTTTAAPLPLTFTSTTTKRPTRPPTTPKPTPPPPPPQFCRREDGGEAELGAVRVVSRRLWSFAKSKRQFVQECRRRSGGGRLGRWFETSCQDEEANRYLPGQEYFHRSGYFTVRCVRAPEQTLSLDIVKCVSDNVEYDNNTEWAGHSVVHRCVLHHDYDFLTAQNKDYSAAHEIVACMDDKGSLVKNGSEWLAKDGLHYRVCEITPDALEASQPIRACVGQRASRLDCFEDLSQFRRLGFGRYACEMCARTRAERIKDESKPKPKPASSSRDTINVTFLSSFSFSAKPIIARLFSCEFSDSQPCSSPPRRNCEYIFSSRAEMRRYIMCIVTMMLVVALSRFVSVEVRETRQKQTNWKLTRRKGWEGTVGVCVCVCVWKVRQLCGN